MWCFKLIDNISVGLSKPARATTGQKPRTWGLLQLRLCLTGSWQYKTDGHCVVNQQFLFGYQLSRLRARQSWIYLLNSRHYFSWIITRSLQIQWIIFTYLNSLSWKEIENEFCGICSSIQLWHPLQSHGIKEPRLGAIQIDCRHALDSSHGLGWLQLGRLDWRRRGKENDRENEIVIFQQKEVCQR